MPGIQTGPSTLMKRGQQRQNSPGQTPQSPFPKPPSTALNATGKTGALGFLSEKLVAGIQKKKKTAALQTAQSQQGLTSQVL